MAIADMAQRLNTPTRDPKGPPCSVCLFLDGLSAEDAATFRGILANPAIRYSAISDELRDSEDVAIESRTLARHAKGRCRAGEKLR